MSEFKDKPDSGSWNASCCPSMLLLRTFRIATRTRVLLLAAIAMLALSAGWRLASQILPKDAVVGKGPLAADVSQFTTWPWHRVEPRGGWYQTPFATGVWDRMGFPPEDLAHALPPRLAFPVVRIATSQARGWVGLFYLIGLLWTLFCSAFFGLAIGRMAAMQFTRDDRLGLRDGLAFARATFAAHLGAVGLALAFAVICAIPMLLLGLLMWGGHLGVAIASIGWWVGMLCLGFASISLVLLALGYPLFWGAICCDGSDAYDAISRALAYLKQRSLNYLGYVLFVGFLGMIGWFGVFVISEAAIQLGRWSASCTAGNDRIREIVQTLDGAATDSSTLWFGSQVIGLCDKFIRTMAAGYSFAFVVCGSVGVYLLLRRDIDGVELDEIEVDSDNDPGQIIPLVRRVPNSVAESSPAVFRDDQAHP